jgi:DNA-directed RNA polymerase specialized sigma24 family protein
MDDRDRPDPGDGAAGAPSDDAHAQVARLPERHLAALRAALAGFGDADIAALLGIPYEAVRPTLRLAAAKLVTALAEHPPGPAGRKPAGRNQ